MEQLKSYRSVEMAPTSAVAAAARYVEREWGEWYRLGFAGQTDPVNGTAVYVFQVCASDGSRFLVWADRFENVGTFASALEQSIALELDVEVSG